MNTTAQDVASAAAGPSQEGNPWPKRLGAWKEFSRTFHERGEKIENRYADEREDVLSGASTRVNMFYSNTTVIKESLYNSLPKPDVGRMHKGDWDNEPARVAALIMERALSYEIRCAKFFDAAIKSAILDRLVPGLGTVWVNYIPASGNTPEHLTVDAVYWKDLVYEPQRSWEKVTWVGRKLSYSREDARAKWGDQISSALEDHKHNPSGIESAINSGKVCVIQMWDKKTRKVHHLLESGHILDTIDDPYNLPGFFPTPRPLIASPATKQFLPLPDYYMAQDQYATLDTLYARITLIIEAIRVVGVYDSSQQSLVRMLEGTENTLIPVDNWAMFAERGGVKGSVDWFPVETVAQVLNHLVSTFTFVKNQLFEVTGMADIVRGSSNQYETLGAQQIKAQFASVRLNGFQRDTATFVRDTVRIMAEMMCKLYSDEKLSDVCGQLPYADQQHVQQALQLLRGNYTSKYNIDIEADSLTQSDWSLEQAERMEYVQALSQFLTAAVPAAKENPELSPLLVQIIKFASVGFKGSKELEGTVDSILDQLLTAPPQGEQEKPDPAIQKAQAEIQIKMQEARFKQAERAAELQFMREKHTMEMQFMRERMALDLEKTRAKGQQEIIHAAERQQREHMQDNLRAIAAEQRKEEEN